MAQSGPLKSSRKSIISVGFGYYQISMSWLPRYETNHPSTSHILSFEGDSIALSKLDLRLAWEIGCFAKDLAHGLYSVHSVVVDITLISGQVLFHAAFGSDVTLDDEEWVRKNREVVFRFAKSSHIMDPSNRNWERDLDLYSFK